MTKKQNRKEKPFEVKHPRQAETSVEEQAHHKPQRSKKLKHEGRKSDGDQQPQFNPIPADIESRLSGGLGNLLETNGSERLDGSLLKDGEEEVEPSSGEPNLSAKERKRAERRAAKQARKDEKRNKMGSAGEVNSGSRSESAGDAQDEEEAANTADANAEGKDTSKKSEQRQSKESKKKRKREVESGLDPAENSKNGFPPSEGAVQPSTALLKGPSNSQRFIVFVGNLPYSATAKSIEEHFSSIAPFTIRLLTDKRTKKPRGCAFVEFEGYDKMKSCLKLYHHSSFNDGKSPARKINVELTAGGGGKSEGRMEKIKEKNKKLKEERKREHDKEDKEKSNKGNLASGANADEAGGQPAADSALADKDGGMHPSRRARMKF